LGGRRQRQGLQRARAYGRMTGTEARA
jgi:hypothetical protein